MFFTERNIYDKEIDVYRDKWWLLLFAMISVGRNNPDDMNVKWMFTQNIYMLVYECIHRDIDVLVYI